MCDGFLFFFFFFFDFRGYFALYIAFGGVMASMVLCCVNTVRDSIFFLSNPSPGGMDPNALT